MASNLVMNLAEEKLLIELIQGGNVQVKEDMTLKILEQIKALNEVVPNILNGLEDLKDLVKVKDLADKGFVFVNKTAVQGYNSRKKEIKKLVLIGGEQKIINPANFYVRISVGLFEKFAKKILPYFEGLAEDLKSANIPLITTSYLAITIFSTLLSAVLGLGVYLVFWGPYFWSIFVLPLLCFFLFYTYPSSKASEIDRKINFELPFATIHMGAITGSNIGPVRLFQIISSSNEYPFLGFEFKKVLNRVLVFGYNITSSLKSVARKTKNAKLAELFEGIASNINTGGDLKTYLEKKSESFLIDYRLERERYIELASTFLDVYISVLIAAPLILILVLVIMSLVGISIGGLGINSLIFVSIILIVVLNIIFLIVLNLKQPEI